jgi:hypothetical protein
MSKEEKHKLDADSLGYDRDLMASGNMIHAEALQSPKSAVTVRVRNGETSVTDGPFIETKEYLGGFILIEAKDLNDAIRIAAGIPLAKLGAIEVRPIHSFGPDV